MLAFLLASFVLVAIPGPDQALITRNAIAGGRRGGLTTMLGGASGIGFHATAAVLGLSALLAASAEAFTIVKLVGVAYLLFLAVQTWRYAKVGGGGPEEFAGSHWRAGSSFRQGLLSNALNPKVALFFLTFLPQFLPSDPSALTSLTFAAAFAAVYLSWFTTYVALVDLLSGWLRRPRVRAAIDRTTGGLMLAFATRLALERR